MGWDKTEHNAVIAMVTSGGKTEKDRMLAFFFFANSFVACDLWEYRKV